MDSITIHGASSSSSSSPHSWTYDVFLNFRGEDTRYNFTDHLHSSLDRKGINTFMDTDELERGTYISPALLKAIQGSMISLIIFSENYASSTWCLDELAHIIQCRESKQQMVFPIFYKVDPSHVRHQRGTFGQAIANHECNFKNDMNKVLRWKAALVEAANLSGWHFLHGHESKFIHDIVEEISVRVLNDTAFNVADHPVGIESRVRHVVKLLRAGENNVCMVGIWGIGGIGKTTIARAVYNTIAHKFEGSCFLDNVREESMQHGGLVKLQKIILSKILGGKDLELAHVHEGMNVIKKRLSKKRVLIIVDDANQVDQLKKLVGRSEWFGNGSRIIITTRDKHLLTAHQVNLIYNVKELDDHEAFDLFSANAFPGERRLSDDHKKLASTVVQYARGLPLALVVLGSLLCCGSIEERLDALDGCKKIPNPDLQEALKISYNSLEDHVKEVFLDIACFFKGEDKDHVIQILEGCGLNPKYGLKVLKEKALINVNEDNSIWMHDLIEEMGKEIVRQESPLKPGKRSRLWSPEDVYQVLTEGRGTNKIKGIMIKLPRRDGIRLSSSSFSKMINLKLFINSNAHLSGEIGFLPNELRFIDWPEFSSEYLPFDSYPKKLLKLNMPRSYMSGLGEGFKSLANLKSINLESCQFLTKFPDASGFPYLKELNLNYCISLVKVHHSVGFLDKLVALSLEGCNSLTSFPTRIALKSVKNINLRGCRMLNYFPETVEKMECITFLDLSHSVITELPSSIGYLVSLEVLTLAECQNLTNLSCSIYELQHLKSVNLFRCQNLAKFPKWSADSLPTNSNISPDLRYLNLSGCKSLKEIPELPPKVERVNAAGCVSLERFAKLSSILEHKEEQMIEYVILFDCQKLCDNLAHEASKIEHNSLNKVSLCSVFLSSKQSQFLVVFPGSEVPKWFSRREDLYELSDKYEFSFEIPQNFKLENSGLAICAAVEINKELKDTIQRFEDLEDDEEDLKSAEYINSRGCRMLEHFPELLLVRMEGLTFLDLSTTAIRELPSSIRYLIRLEMLFLKECENLTNLPCSIYELKDLLSVNLSGCRNLSTFPKWTGGSLPNNSSISNLWHVRVRGCKSLQEIPELPPKVKYVDAADCISLERFAKLSSILEHKDSQMIKSVSLLNCKKLCDTLAQDVTKIENILLNEGTLCSVFLTSKQSQFDIVFPGSEVPKWFSHREDLYELIDRSEFFFQIPLNFKPENRGLAICAAAEISQTEKEITQSDFGRCYFTARIDINAETFATHSFNFKAKAMKSAHVWLLYIPFVKIVHYLSTPFMRPLSTCRVSLEHTSEGSMCCTSYGVHLVMLPQDEDLEDEETHEDLEDEYFTCEDDEDI
ncbi:hypothetical protein L3X38_043553 [Prunus dulcis]|uniref:TIR domain-containing protein n=1 Tax=Prunus dulcis TaxID=3755 RepID=A0AAD4YLD3_PRUDU|nr:hypothetical protein L3X38_043553 [Prunus dulcis]